MLLLTLTPTTTTPPFPSSFLAMSRHSGYSQGHLDVPQSAPHNEDIETSTTEASGPNLNKTTKPTDTDNPLRPFNHTPPASKYQGDQRTHLNSQRTRESAICHGLPSTVEKFADNYLRECDDFRKDLSDKHWNKFKEDISEISSESCMYPIAAKLLTEVCIAVCNPRTFSLRSALSASTDTLIHRERFRQLLSRISRL